MAVKSLRVVCRRVGQAIEAGAAAVAAQCRGIEAWAARAGKPKRAAAPPSLAALEAAVARLAGPDLEASYRNAAGGGAAAHESNVTSLPACSWISWCQWCRACPMPGVCWSTCCSCI